MTNRIVVDIGNTRIACGVFCDGRLVDLSHHLLSNTEKACQDIIRDADAMKISQIALCSVVPSVARSMLDILHQNERAVFEIREETQMLISDTYESLGADRLANIAGALKLYVKDECAIVIDFGSATTLTAVSPEGKFLGGLITLGLGNTFRALHQSTEQLPELDTATGGQLPAALAFDTAGAIKSGCIHAHIGIVDQWISIAKQELGSKTTVVATGGYITSLAPLIKSVDHVDQNLTIHGINFIAEAAMGPTDRV